MANGLWMHVSVTAGNFDFYIISIFFYREEQAELTDSILKAEDDQLNAKLELINVKSELLKEFDSLREKYSALLKKNPENDIEPAVRRKRQKSEQMDKQMEQLKDEEDRLNEIR